MTRVQGRIQNVSEEVAGSETVAAYANSSTDTIQVAETYPFSLGEDGQQTVMINGVLHYVFGVDYENDTLTFEEPIFVDIAEGDEVTVVPAGSLKVAMVDLGDGDEGITAIIPMELVDRFNTGIRDPWEMESVFVSDDSGRWVLSDADEEIPYIQGGYINPEGLHDPEPEDPPGTSPALSVTGLPTALVVRALDEIAASTVVEYHMSLTNPTFVPTAGDPVTLVAATGGRVVVIDRTPTDQPLIEGQQYYISAIARNTAGAAPASTPVAGQVDMDAIASVVAAEVVAGFILAGTIEVGDITIDADDGIRIQQANGYIHFPADSNLPAKFVGDVETANLTSRDRLDIYKLAQVFGTIRAVSGITNPTAPPTFGAVWDQPSSSAGGSYPANNWGLVESIWTGGGAKWVTVTDFFNVFAVLDASGNQIGGGASSPMPADFYPTSIARIGSRYYVLGSKGTPEGSEPWIYVFSHTALNTITHIPSESWRAVPLITSGPQIGQYEVNRWTEFDGSAHYSVSNAKRQALGTDGTSLYVVRYHTFSGATRAVIRAWNPANVGVSTSADRNIHTGTAVLATPGHAPVDIIQLHAKQYDFSAVRWTVITGTNNYVYSTTVTSSSQYVRVAADDWTKAISGGTTRGMGWDSTDLRFYSLDTYGYFWKYVKSHVNSSTIYAKYTWRDNDIAGTGKHETAGSPAGTGTWLARAKVRIIGQPAPERDSTADDAADQVNIYASSALAGTYRLQHLDGGLLLTHNYFDLETLDTVAGAVIPGANGFDAISSPGKFESGKADGSEQMWSLSGSGEGKLGKNKFDVDGHWNYQDGLWGSIGISRSTALAVANGTWTGMAANFTGWNPAGAGWYTTPSGYVQVQQAGFYEVLCSVHYDVATPAADGNRRRLLRIYVGSTLAVQTGTVVARVEIGAFAGLEPAMQATAWVYLSALDYVIPQLWHNQGASLNANNCATTVRKVG